MDPDRAGSVKIITDPDLGSAVVTEPNGSGINPSR
jgi:hypothetical protein